MTDAQIITGEATECVPNSTTDEDIADEDDLNLCKIFYLRKKNQNNRIVFQLMMKTVKNYYND